MNNENTNPINEQGQIHAQTKKKKKMSPLGGLAIFFFFYLYFIAPKVDLAINIIILAVFGYAAFYFYKKNK